MDQERLVSNRRPSSVSATMSSKLMPGFGSRLTFVIRISGMRFQPSARIAPPAGPADARRGLPRAQVAGEDPLLDQRDLLGHHALVVPAERAQAARDGGVGDDVAQVAAVAEGAQHVRRQEARAGVGRLGAEGAVQLRGVAAALVHLHVELGRVQQDGPRAGGQGRGGEQLHGLARDALGVAREVHRPDVLVAGRGPGPAVVRVAAALVLVAVDRVGLEARADVRDHLLRVGAVAGGEGLPLALGAVDGLRPGDALDRVHGPVRGEEVRDLAVQRDGERVLGDGALEAARAPAGGRPG